ncbi:RHS repeat-associated core domain-containing protein [Alkalihalobacillus sp. AL-G]|uniref:RHS repeat-associated core domain-containing protein n=1 Tax=Alkalihalobacillus sp. AL-G TaxID=2926399 RepID=UPI00272A5F7C|nr:RHS repeat-associated core domain-containing protein [Alkalihalobacillus sp. AL-G]WLD94439.1 hypothetical protein MOJ78_05995 [Alkalihalobacillus sp. AL-G]
MGLSIVLSISRLHLGLIKQSGSETVWFKTETEGSSRHILANEADNREILNVYIDTDNKVKISYRNSAGVFGNLLTTDEVIPKDQWNFMGLKWEYVNSSLNVALFVNGTKYTATTTDFKDFTDGTTALGTSIAGNNPLNGYMDQFSYSSTALTDSEILEIFNKGRGQTVHYTYDSLGRNDQNTVHTGSATIKTSFAYKEGINGATTNQIDSVTQNGQTISYMYDANGNIDTITKNGEVIAYEYNEANELIREDNSILNKTIVYQYDGGGNLLTKKIYAYTTAETPGTLLDTISYSYDTAWKDKLISYEGKAITYDEIGNPLTYDGYSYAWKFGDQLAGISGNGLTTTYKYNADGIRTEKTVNGVTTTYHLDGDLVTYETNGTDEIYYTYSSNDKLVSMNLNGKEYFYLRNIQGDITGLADESGTEVVSYQYDTWGKLISITGTLADTVGKKNPYRYRGYRYDSETGLYYLNARYYNPEWSRFINTDSYGGEIGELLSHNVYAYCVNNPVNNVDPSGHWYARIDRYSGSSGTLRTNEKLGESIQITNPSYNPSNHDSNNNEPSNVEQELVSGTAGSHTEMVIGGIVDNVKTGSKGLKILPGAASSFVEGTIDIGVFGEPTIPVIATIGTLGIASKLSTDITLRNSGNKITAFAVGTVYVTGYGLFNAWLEDNEHGLKQYFTHEQHDWAPGPINQSYGGVY